jgi:hypothetical protein
MSFLGKILTVLIFFLSVTFMAFAVAVYATHKNWYDRVHNTDASKGEMGLLKQLEDAKQENARLDREKRDLENQLNTEKVMRRLAISRAETTHQLDQKAIADKEAQLKAEMASNATATATVKSTQEFIASLNKEIEDVRNTLKTTRESLDQTHASMVAQTDKVHQLMLLKKRLEDQQLVLAEQLRKANNVLAAHNLKLDDPVDDSAPRAEAVVTSVRQDGRSIFVTVSLGKDDGIRPGHQMNVFRGDRYVGRITIRSVEPNRSVGESDPTYYERPFQVSDIARTITPEAPTTARR